jgi:hypothetical protein
VKYQRMTKYRRGILCTNSFCSRRGWEGCHKSWCVKFYKPSLEDRYPIRLPVDGDGRVMLAEEDEDRFGLARPGDHLFCPFQYELCLFRNIQGRSPFGGGVNDVVLLCSLRRANLDAFWIREPDTVAESLSKVNRILQLSFGIGMKNPPLPLAEPWPVKDKMNAVGTAVVIRYSWVL